MTVKEVIHHVRHLALDSINNEVHDIESVLVCLITCKYSISHQVTQTCRHTQLPHKKRTNFMSKPTKENSINHLLDIFLSFLFFSEHDLSESLERRGGRGVLGEEEKDSLKYG